MADYSSLLPLKLIHALNAAKPMETMPLDILPKDFANRTLIDLYRQDPALGTSLFDKSPVQRQDNLYIYCYDVHSDFGQHRHDFFEILYVCKGRVINQIDGEKIYMGQGDLCLHNTCAQHKLECVDKSAVLLNIDLMPPLFEGMMRTYYQDDNLISNFLRGENEPARNYMFFAARADALIPNRIREIIHEYTREGFRTSFALEAHLILLFITLDRLGEYSFYGVDEATQQILDYIRENCTCATLNEMAQHFHYTPNYLTRLIKMRTGRNCKDIMKEAKLQQAVGLLSNSKMPIGEIAEKVGYHSISHFFKVFKDEYGITPRQYRLLIES